MVLIVQEASAGVIVALGAHHIAINIKAGERPKNSYSLRWQSIVHLFLTPRRIAQVGNVLGGTLGDGV